MKPERSPMEGFGRAWAQSLESNPPPLDIQASLARLQGELLRRSQSRNRAPRSRYIPWIAAAAAVILVVVGGLRLHRAPEPLGWVGPVTVAQSGLALETRVGETRPLRFSEGSEVLLEGQSRVELRSVNAHGASIALLNGVVSASIVHREATKWMFLAGPFTVRVTGTRLRVLWQPADEQFEVEVTEGSVFVTGPLLDAGHAVRAGQRCIVQIPQAKFELRGRAMGPAIAPAELPSVKVAEPPAPRGEGLDPTVDDPVRGISSVGTHPTSAGPTSAGPPGPSSSLRRVVESWRDLERRGRYAEAVAAAQQEGVSGILERGGGQDLLALARAARFVHRVDLERIALLRCRERFSGQAQAAMAAFLLGRSSGPAEAATWFALYLKEQPNGSLAREAAGRFMESQALAGNSPVAREAAHRYLAAYPDGPHSAFARQVLEGHAAQ